MKYQVWAELWLQEQQKKVRSSTMECYRSAMRNHILPLLGEVDMGVLNGNCLQNAIDRWSENGRADGKGGLAPKTIHDLMSIVRQSMLAAEQAGVAKSCSPTLRYPQMHKAARPDTLSRAECKVLYKRFLNEDSPTGLGIKLALGAGMRIGEICALRWENVHPVRKTVQVRQTLQRLPKQGHVLNPPKTASSVREIPILPDLYRELQRLRPEDERLFVLTGTKVPMEPRILRARFAGVLKECGIEHVRFHTLRHTFATLLIESGADCTTVSELLGHASVETTLGFYMHPSMDHKRKCIESLYDGFKSEDS